MPNVQKKKLDPFAEALARVEETMASGVGEMISDRAVDEEEGSKEKDGAIASDS